MDRILSQFKSIGGMEYLTGDYLFAFSKIKLLYLP